MSTPAAAAHPVDGVIEGSPGSTSSVGTCQQWSVLTSRTLSWWSMMTPTARRVVPWAWEPATRWCSRSGMAAAGSMSAAAWR
jgi:hypothetical protein